MSSDYIRTMSNDEKIAFFKLFCKMIYADNVIDAKEIENLKQVAVQYGVDGQTLKDIIRDHLSINVAVEAGRITSREHALELIKELCMLANIDGNADDKELDIIIDAAGAMGIDDEKVVLINRWVLDCIILNKAGNIIMERNNE